MQSGGQPCLKVLPKLDSETQPAFEADLQLLAAGEKSMKHYHRMSAACHPLKRLSALIIVRPLYMALGMAYCD